MQGGTVTEEPVGNSQYVWNGLTNGIGMSKPVYVLTEAGILPSFEALDGFVFAVDQAGPSRQS